jgi:hypothetical protein
MSEQPTAPPRPGPPGAGGKKYGGLSRNQWFIVGGVFFGALGYLWWRRRQAAAAGNATQTPTSAGSNECTDANGNPVDCGELTAQELAAIQNQLDQLQGQAGGSGGGSSGGGYSIPDMSGATGAATGTSTTTANPAGTPTSSSGTTSSGTATAAKTAGPISGLTSSAVTKTSFKASWNAASNATGGYSYAVRNLASHTQVTAGTTRATSVTVSGLKSGIDYNFGIQGLPGGAGANIHVRTK